MQLYNPILLTGFIAWCTSQAIKSVIHLIIHKKLEWERLMGDGGMPSSHSAMVSATATAAGLTCGWDSPVFAVAVIFSLIVMHDAKGIRQETGKQARVINSMLDLFESMGSGKLTPEETLKEFVGHTRRQVYVGCGYGILLALALHQLWT